jgi:hypothetical protein
MTAGYTHTGEFYCTQCGRPYTGLHVCYGAPYQPTPMTAAEFRQILREELEHHRSELDKASR